MNTLKNIGIQEFPNINYKFMIYELEHEVISCVQAAEAKGIHVKNELKTLVLETSKGICTINISGEKQISLRKIKKFLQVNEAHLASNEILNILNLIPGAVCPFLNQLFVLPMLIDKDILNLQFLSTNNGTRNRFILFPPDLLTMSPNHYIDSFSKS